MSSGQRQAEGFSAAQAKLQKPTKQSAFERQKAEAEAKRKREAEETAAVYADFVKSFDRDGDDDGRRDSMSAFGPPSKGKLGVGGGVPPGHGASKRHFVSSGMKSGPGSLGPPPTSFAKKRSFNDFRGGAGERQTGFDDAPKSTSVATAFDASDDEDTHDVKERAEEKAIAKPTLRLANMPPGTSPAAVKALIPENLSVEDVKILPPVGPGGSERKCAVAIVTLSKETPANDMDAAVSALQNRYLGYGYYLSLHRHLSSAIAASASLASLSSSTPGAHPFGARPVEQQTSQDKSMHHQQGFRRGFAPPSSYSSAGAGVSRAQLLHVPVQPPQDVRTVQLVNKTIEGILEHGPEFEALLMSRPEVQRDGKWAWIWDARSKGGIWFRWRLWQIVTGSEFKNDKGKYVPLFDGGHAWKSPEKGLTFEYTTSLDEFVSDAEYNSSDDEDEDAEGNGDPNGPEKEMAFLNPLDKAKLVHLLARLPTSLSKLRKGDIARVTAFAITHASRGADEVVDMIVANVEKPLSLTLTQSQKKQGARPSHKVATTDESVTNEGPDSSAASLVALYAVSDVLSSSSTSGVRHAWRFRQLFETAIRERKVFERLGTLAERLQWGRLRVEKWKRSISLVLSLWESWCVFPAESQELFVRTFESPPSTKTEEKTDESSSRAKWKSVEALPIVEDERQASAGVAVAAVPARYDATQDDVDGEPLEEDDVMGEPIDEEDVEGESIDDDDVAGDPIPEVEHKSEPMDQDESWREKSEGASQAEEVKRDAGADPEAANRGFQRRRMRAADLFDEER